MEPAADLPRHLVSCGVSLKFHKMPSSGREDFLINDDELGAFEFGLGKFRAASHASSVRRYSPNSGLRVFTSIGVKGFFVDLG